LAESFRSWTRISGTRSAILPQGLLGEGDTVLQKPFTAGALAERVRDTLVRFRFRVLPAR
jgi:hypothetical protein